MQISKIRRQLPHHAWSNRRRAAHQAYPLEAACAKKRRKDRNPQLGDPPSHGQSSIRNAPINPEESPSLRGPDLAPSGAGIKTFFSFYLEIRVAADT
jgi:hypothetical protein